MNTLVIKIGGALMASPSAFDAFSATLLELQSQFSICLVHGGGDIAHDWLAKLGFDSEKRDGVRVTPESHLPFVVGALAGAVNTQLCGQLLKTGIKPVGLTLLDGASCRASQLDPAFGQVGQALANNPSLLNSLLENGFMPVIASIAADDQGRLLNVNADDAAVAIAKLLGSELVLLTDVPGVLDGHMQLIPQLNAVGIDSLISDGVVSGGMVVKVRSALAAANLTQQPVTIASWKQPEQLLNLSRQKAGTRILPSASDGGSDHSVDNNDVTTKLMS